MTVLWNAICGKLLLALHTKMWLDALACVSRVSCSIFAIFYKAEKLQGDTKSKDGCGRQLNLYNVKHFSQSTK